MGHIVICGMTGAKVFLHIISQTARLSDKVFIEYEMCVLIFCATFVRNIALSKKN